MLTNPVALKEIGQGCTETYTFVLSRTSPAFDATTCTAIEFRANEVEGARVFTKTLGVGVAATAADTIAVTVVGADTAALAGARRWILEYELVIVAEADGRAPSPAVYGTLPVRAQLPA